MKQYTASLLVLAAGMGSRYGGLKQIDGFGPQQESLLEYSVYDARAAGFDHFVFVIRKDFEDQFVKKFEKMLSVLPAYDLVYQEFDPVFEFATTKRTKPRGTVHAMLAGKECIHNPFCVINADDYYGKDSYKQMFDSLPSCDVGRCILITYILENTLSDHGKVNRGLCSIDEHRSLSNIHEGYGISYSSDGSITDRDGVVVEGSCEVSMNMWGFHHSLMDFTENYFVAFAKKHAGGGTDEMVIPDLIEMMTNEKGMSCLCKKSHSSWYGVTNPEDKPAVSEAFMRLHEEGVYPEYLRKQEL